MTEKTVKKYALEETTEAFLLASEIPEKEAKTLFGSYLTYYATKGKQMLSKYEHDIDEMNLFIRLGAYERFIHEYLVISSFPKMHNRIVRLVEAEAFKRAIAPVTQGYEEIRKLSIAQKFLLATTQELGFSQVDITRTLQTVLDLFYDLYDEEQSFVDGRPLIEACQEVVSRYDFKAYDVCVKDYGYSPSTFSSLYRPFFRRIDMIDRDEVAVFMDGYVSLARYRTLYSNHRNIGNFKNRAIKFNEFIARYTEEAILSRPHKSLSLVKHFVDSKPKSLHVFQELMESFTQDLHMYLAMLAYLDPAHYDDFFDSLEENANKVEEFLEELKDFSAKHNDVPTSYPFTGSDDIAPEQETLFSGQTSSAPKVEVVPGENRLASVTPEPTEDSHLVVIEETELDDSDDQEIKVPDQFSSISEEVAYRRQQAEIRSGEITGSMIMLRMEIEKLELELMETQALISFYDTYTKNNPDS